MFDEKVREKYNGNVTAYGPPAGIIPGSWYDQKYYDEVGLKSNWPSPFKWEIWQELYTKIAHFILAGFPFAKSFLDVGCAKGFLIKAMMKYAQECKLDLGFSGFDHSEYAIENAVPEAKPFISVASVDNYEFVRAFDMLICMDVLEHLTEDQGFRFLERARRYINHNVFAVIPHGQEHGVTELSHITLRPREYWIETFTRAGWIRDADTIEQEQDAMRHDMVRVLRWNVYVFKS